MEKYTVEQFNDYVIGWTGAGSTKLSINEMRAALHNSLAMLEDCQDGIEHFIRRKYSSDIVDWSME